jgi:hypothetical protein
MDWQCLRGETHEAGQHAWFVYIRNATLRAHFECESGCEGKEYVDPSRDFDGIPIKESGLIAPLFDGVNGCGHQIGRAAD